MAKSNKVTEPKAEIVGGNVVITLPLFSKPVEPQSEDSPNLIVCSTGGYKLKGPNLKYKGKDIRINVLGLIAK